VPTFRLLGPGKESTESTESPNHRAEVTALARWRPWRTVILLVMREEDEANPPVASATQVGKVVREELHANE